MIDSITVPPRRTRLLYLLILLQLLFLVGMAGSYYAVGWYGSEIKLKTVPVDPHDLLYGDYVTLSYEISQLPLSSWKGEGTEPQQGERVYVLLKPANGVYEAEGIYPDKPPAGSGEAVLKGIVRSAWEDGIRLDYGLEKYYVPEGTGKPLEQRAGDMIATVKIASWGQARLIDIR